MVFLSTREPLPSKTRRADAIGAWAPVGKSRTKHLNRRPKAHDPLGPLAVERVCEIGFTHFKGKRVPVLDYIMRERAYCAAKPLGLQRVLKRARTVRGHSGTVGKGALCALGACNLCRCMSAVRFLLKLSGSNFSAPPIRCWALSEAVKSAQMDIGRHHPDEGTVLFKQRTARDCRTLVQPSARMRAGDSHSAKRRGDAHQAWAFCRR